MRVLLLECGYKLNMLVKKISENEKVQMIFTLNEIYPENQKVCTVDIKQSIDEIIDFVEANEIDFTICTDSDFILQNIKEKFEERNLLIFTAAFNSVKMAFYNSIAKKFIYKNGIKTPKFGVFEKESLAISYLEDCKFPIVIRCDFYKDKPPKLFESYSAAIKYVKDLFFSNIQRIVIEEYKEFDYFNYYVIGDGNRFFPLPPVEQLYKDNKTLFVAPSLKLDVKNEQFIIKKIIAPVIASIKQNSIPLNGLLGFELGLDKVTGEPFVLNFLPEISEEDLFSVLSVLDYDIFDIFYFATINVLSDECSRLNIKDETAITVKVDKNKVFEFDGVDVCFNKYTDDNILLCSSGLIPQNIMRKLEDCVNEEN